MNELLKEIFLSMKQNKLRTILTGFSVAWGIFMLIILLGAGNGLQNGVTSNFEGKNLNTINVNSSRTQEAYMGYNKYRRIKLRYNDVEYLKKVVPNIGTITSYRNIWSRNIAYSEKNTFTTCYITGTTPLFPTVSSSNFNVNIGRFINETDLEQNRKIVVISEYIAKTLFADEDPLNKKVTIDNISYVVVGIAETSSPNSPVVYIPITTSLIVYNISNHDEIRGHIVEVLNVNTIRESQLVEKNIKDALAAKYSFSKDDKGGVRMWADIESVMQLNTVFGGISSFVWIIGLGTLMAGIVGVSNIMLVTVRERTNEFGIRKSMGATPSSLVRLILIEAVAITVMFGYIGIVGGTFTLEAVNYVMEMMPKSGGDGSPEMFLNPTIDLSIAMYATVVLVIAGTFAGYIPARRAARLKTIDAMRYNK